MMEYKGLLIGLTGQTGAGKSTVAARFREHGLTVVDADRAARAVMQPGSTVLRALSEAFGADILLPDGALDRARLARRAFSSPEQTALLNRITHPAIIQKIHETIGLAFSGGEKAVVLDAPQLFESGENRACGLIIAVFAPEALRIRRIMQRDRINEESARLRANAQKSEAYYRAHADLLVRNYPPFDLQQELLPVWERIGQLVKDGPVIERPT